MLGSKLHCNEIVLAVRHAADIRPAQLSEINLTLWISNT